MALITDHNSERKWSMFKVGILTASDKGSRGEREDLSGQVIKSMVEKVGWEVKVAEIVPDKKETIIAKLKEFADQLKLDVIFTTGGTGFSPRDVTPEATLAVVERLTPGIPEAMRWASLKKTPRAMLSRAVAGIRGQTIIINLPGSPKGVQECLEVVLSSLEHGLEILKGTAGECAATSHVGTVLAVNISAVKGIVKDSVPEARVIENWGLEGDAHAGDWDRQVSIFPEEALAKVPEEKREEVLSAGYTENFTIKGIPLEKLMVGSILRIGECEVEICQVGKEHKEFGRPYIVSREGRFGRVLKGGLVKVGNQVVCLK